MSEVVGVDAGKFVRLAPEPLNVPAVNVFVPGLYVKLLPPSILTVLDEPLVSVNTG